jgi:hypothetical protein
MTQQELKERAIAAIERNPPLFANGDSVSIMKPTGICSVKNYTGEVVDVLVLFRATRKTQTIVFTWEYRVRIDGKKTKSGNNQFMTCQASWLTLKTPTT